MAYKKPEPQIREGKEIEIRSALATLVHRFLKDTNAYRNCLNCVSWDYINDQCGKFKAKPPTDIIVNACPAYEDDNDIPF